MKHAFEIGVRHASLPPMVCEEIRVITLASQTGQPATFATLVTRTFWTLLVSNHIERYREAPSQDDCESYRLLAELIAGDSISSIDTRVHDLFEKSEANEDALLLEARTLLRFTQGLQRQEALREQRAVEALHRRAVHYANAVS
jgi:hypothetical protein